MTRYSVLLVVALGVLLAVAGCGGKGGRIGTTPEPRMAPEVVSISPQIVDEADARTMQAKVLGSTPFTYLWDFGGGAEPNESTERQPRVRFPKSGVYSASLTVTNAYGEVVMPFELVVGRDYPVISEFNATKGTVPGAVVIKWQVDPAYGAPTGFRLRRSTSASDPYQLIAELDPAAREYNDPQPAGLLVSYELDAWNKYGSQYGTYYYPGEPEYDTGWAASEQAALVSEQSFDDELVTVAWLSELPVVITCTDTPGSEDPDLLKYHVNTDPDGRGEWLHATVLETERTSYLRDRVTVIDGAGYPLLLFVGEEFGAEQSGLWITSTSSPLDVESWETARIDKENDPEPLCPYHQRGTWATVESGRIFVLWRCEAPIHYTYGAALLSYTELPPGSSSWKTDTLSESAGSSSLGSFKEEILIALRVQAYPVGGSYFGRAPASQDTIKPAFIESTGIPCGWRFLEVGEMLMMVETEDSSGPEFSLPVDPSTYSMWERKYPRGLGRERLIGVWRNFPVSVTSVSSVDISDGSIDVVSKWVLTVYTDVAGEGAVYCLPLGSAKHAYFRVAAINGELLSVATTDLTEQDILTIYDLSSISIPEL